MLESLLALTTAFPYSVSSLMLVNVLFYAALVIRGAIIQSRWAFIVGLVFATWVLLSVIFASVTLPQFGFDSRVVIQSAFSIQYFVLALRLNIDSEKLFKWFTRFALIFAVCIIGAFFFTGTFRGWVPFTNRLWGSQLFPGWPNGISVPLGFALWGILQKDWLPKYRYPAALLLTSALFLTTSRGAVLTFALIWVWHLYTLHIWGRVPRFMKVVAIFGLVALGVSFVFASGSDQLIYSLTKSYDRESLANTSFQLIELSPIFGYGSRTLEQVQYMMPVSIGAWSATQTHNMFLEIAVRHGLVGVVLLAAFFFFLFRKMRGSDEWVMFIVLFVLGLTQDFIRNFSFLFVWYLLAHYCGTQGSFVKVEKNSAELNSSAKHVGRSVAHRGHC